MVYVCEGTKLAVPWQCPEQGCGFTTDVKRARAAHLLRVHHLLFRGRGKAPLPLDGQELQDRLEAFRRRNRGSKQRARENRRMAAASARVDGGSPTPPLSDDLVAGSVANPDLTLEEDWSEAATFELLLDEDFESALASLEAHDHSDWQLVPYISAPVDRDEELLPRGISISEFAGKVVSWRGLSIQDVVLKAKAEWGIGEEDEPRLLMSVKLVLASRMNTAFNLLEAFQPCLQNTPDTAELCRRMAEELVLLASGL